MASAVPAAIAGTVLSNASRYGALQRVFNDNLREFQYQRSQGTRYQIWTPPGVVFCKLKKDHFEHGRYAPPWSEWGFEESGTALRLVLGALSGRWAVWLSKHHEQEQWVVADNDSGRLFEAYHRAMNAFGLDAAEPDTAFPNLRLLLANERFAPKFFDHGALRSVHVHLPHAERATRPPRAALISGRFAEDVCAALGPEGELHVVTDSEAVMEDASAHLMESRRFAPCLGFPFYAEGVPSSYPAAALLRRDAAGGRADRAASQRLFHSTWERRPEQLPNFRFTGG